MKDLIKVLSVAVPVLQLISEISNANKPKLVQQFIQVGNIWFYDPIQNCYYLQPVYIINNYYS